jgi:two-component system NtrC family sensor kinase
MAEKGGRIDITASRVDDQVELRVADTGPGIPRTKLTKIFDPFYTTKHTGTGLGLFVSQRIILGHNGTLTVQSTEGQGTTFLIRLPAVHEIPSSSVSA